MFTPHTKYRMAANGVTLESTFADSQEAADRLEADGWEATPEDASPQPEPAADKPE